MRVVVADDQPEVRSALRLTLEEKSGITRVYEADSSRKLLSLLETECPELVLLDWELPGSSPLKLLASMRLLRPAIRIIALSSRPQMKQSALAAGADAFVCKSDPPETLLKALG